MYVRGIREGAFSICLTQAYFLCLLKPFESVQSVQEWHGKKCTGKNTSADKQTYKWTQLFNLIFLILLQISYIARVIIFYKLNNNKA